MKTHFKHGDRDRASDTALFRREVASVMAQSGEAACLVEEKELRRGRVYRQLWRVGDRDRGIVAKQLPRSRARRERAVVRHLREAGWSGDIAPRLLACFREPDDVRVWHFYEDLGDWTLDQEGTRPGDPLRPRDRGFLQPMQRRVEDARLASVVRLVAQIHDAFAGHSCLPELRRSTCDLGPRFLEVSVRRAIRALEGLRAPRVALCASRRAIRDRLLESLIELRSEEKARIAQIEAIGGEETLLHGDLSVRNALACPSGNGWNPRLIDWDHAGVGPVSYDLSNLLAQLPACQRAEALDLYQELRSRPGRVWPAAREWNELFDSAERARLANTVIWLAAEAQDDAGQAFEQLAQVSAWLAALGRTLPTADPSCATQEVSS